MPAPDEISIWLEVYDPPYVRMGCACYGWQNPTHIRRRAARLGHKYAQGWHCGYCDELMPVWKRIDAVYCSESCRKLAARKRRVARGGAVAIAGIDTEHGHI